MQLPSNNPLSAVRVRKRNVLYNLLLLLHQWIHISKMLTQKVSLWATGNSPPPPPPGKKSPLDNRPLNYIPLDNSPLLNFGREKNNPLLIKKAQKSYFDPFHEKLPTARNLKINQYLTIIFAMTFSIWP